MAEPVTTDRVEVRDLDRRWSRGRWWLAAVAVWVTIGVARALYVLPRLVGPTEDMHHGARGLLAPLGDRATFGDFRDTVWLPIRDLVAGGNPYDAPAYLARHPYAFEFSYSPSQLTLFSPWAVPPWTAAATLWFLALLASSVLVALLVRRLADLPRRWDVVLVVACAVLLVRPMSLMLGLGQTSVVPLLAAGLALARRREDRLTVVCLALAWLKPQFGIPLTVLLLAAGLRRSVWRGLVLAVLLALPAGLWAVVNAGGVGPFLSSLPSSGDVALASRSSQYVTADLASLVEHFTGGEGSAALLTVCFLVVIGTGALAARAGWRAAVAGPAAYTAATASVLLCLPHGEYDLLLLVLPLALCSAAAVRARGSAGIAVPAALTALLALAVLPRGADQVDVHELLMTLAVVGLAWLVARPGADRRSLLLLVGLVLGTLVLRYGVDRLTGPDATGYGLLPTLSLLAAWLVAVVAVARAPRADRSAVRVGRGAPVL